MVVQIVELVDKVPRNPHYTGSISAFSDFLALGHKKSCSKNLY